MGLVRIDRPIKQAMLIWTELRWYTIYLYIWFLGSTSGSICMRQSENAGNQRQAMQNNVF